MDKLIISGHSFGGGTAVGAGIKDDRIKACLPLDPWLWPYRDELKNMSINKPFFMIYSETYFKPKNIKLPPH